MRPPENLRPTEQQKRPLLEQLIDDVLKRHASKKSIGTKGNRRPYYVYSAISDTLRGSSKSPQELFDSLTTQTSLTPSDLARRITFEFLEDNWDKFRVRAAQYILEVEMEIRHPEAFEEDERREEYWERRQKN